MVEIFEPIYSIWGAIAGAVIGAGASLLGGKRTDEGQREANLRNIELSREQMRFQERMSSTAYQRAASDLQSAGLNRILAIGSPSSTPSGAMAVTQNEEAGMGAAIADAPSSALAVSRQLQDLKLAKAQTGNVTQATATARADQLLKAANADISTAKLAEQQARSALYTDVQGAYGSAKSMKDALATWMGETIGKGVTTAKELMYQFKRADVERSMRPNKPLPKGYHTRPQGSYRPLQIVPTINKGKPK